MFVDPPAIVGLSPMALSETDIQRQKEIQQAEELLFSGRQELGFAKSLFFGRLKLDIWQVLEEEVTRARAEEET